LVAKASGSGVEVDGVRSMKARKRKKSIRKRVSVYLLRWSRESDDKALCSLIVSIKIIKKGHSHWNMGN